MHRSHCFNRGFPCAQLYSIVSASASRRRVFFVLPPHISSPDSTAACIRLIHSSKHLLSMGDFDCPAISDLSHGIVELAKELGHFL